MAVSEAVLALSAVFFAVTPDDVDAAYRQNAHQATTIRVDWVRTQRTSADLLQRLKLESLEYRKLLDSGEVLPEMRATVEQMAAPGIDSAFKQPLPLSAVLDYWSDRESFQLRILNDDGQPNYYSTDPPPRIIHPDVESLVGDFPKALSQYMVITGRGSGQPLRVWLGSKQAPQYSYHRALVSFKPPVTPGTVEFFPPLALPASDWKGTVHRMDEFFALGHGRAEWIGTATIDGVETQVVTKAWLAAGNLPKDIWLVLRAFVDMSRGGIPLRIESFAGRETDLPTLFDAKASPLNGDAPPLPNWIIRDVEIKEVMPGMFYPMSGFEDQLTRAPENIDVTTKKRSVVHQTTEWRAFRVEPNRKMTPAMFEMKFPGNTVLRDETTNQIWLTGDANEHAELVVNRAMPKVRSKWWWNASLVGAACLSIVGLVWFARKRWRRRVA